MGGGSFFRLLFAGALALVLLGAGMASAADAFSAHGSAYQFYATGLAPSQTTVLLNKKGKNVATQKADSLGGIVFRNVKPGTGYRVRAGGHASDPLTVLSTRSAPPSTTIYDQSIPSSGYGYLTTRDGTKLSLYVHPPQDVANRS